MIEAIRQGLKADGFEVSITTPSGRVVVHLSNS